MMKKIRFAWPQGLEGAMTTSWDDGAGADRRLVEIFNRHGIKGTWNLNGMFYDPSFPKDDRVRADEVARLYEGHEVATHGFTHPWFCSQSDEQIRNELRNDRIMLENLVGYPVRGHALPFGHHDARVDRVLAECGILFSRTTGSHKGFHLPANFIEWHPTCHHKHGIHELWDNFLKSRLPDRLFYLWGHSYEFNNDNNWDLIESFCEKAGATPGIWHATNMQVYEYVTGWRSLFWTHDMTAVRNVSGQTIFFREGDTLDAVEPGETRKLA